MTAVPPNDNQQNTEQTKTLCHYCKKIGHVIGDFRKKMQKEVEERNDPSSRTQNLRHLDHLNLVLIANEQIILQKHVGVVPMPLIDPNGSSSRQSE